LNVICKYVIDIIIIIISGDKNEKNKEAEKVLKYKEFTLEIWRT
jgi:hypothetical protein